MAPPFRFARVLWCLAACAALLLFLRAFVGDVRRVESSSMEPALLQGEWVYVRFDTSVPRRGQLVVARPDPHARPVVKRVAGLPGESVRLVQGDLLVDGRPAQDLPDTWIRVEDSQLEPFEARWRLGSGWTRDGGMLRGDAAAGSLELLAIDDGWLRADGVRTAGPDSAPDVRLDARLVRAASPSEVALELHVRGEIVEARLAREEGRIAVRLLRAPDVREEHVERETREELARASLDESASQESWSLRVRDGAVSVLFAETQVCSAQLDAVRMHRADHLQEGRSFPPRAILRFVVGGGAVQRLAVWRDLLWLPAGSYAVERVLDLGPDQCFLLGDASFQSRDGREWGPTALGALVGRPRAVLWPPASWRLLP